MNCLIPTSEYHESGINSLYPVVPYELIEDIIESNGERQSFIPSGPTGPEECTITSSGNRVSRQAAAAGAGVMRPRSSVLLLAVFKNRK